MIIAQMNNIVKRYGKHLALDCVDIDISEGEILGLLGPNGAGKTTLIHSLSGIINIDSGDIKVFDKSYRDNMLDIKKQIGLVTQDIAILWDLTARENLEFFGGIYGLKGEELKRRVDDVLETVGLAEYGKKLPTKFSGGMQRRLNIACALIHKPKLLILDEPTVGIDPQSRRHIIDTVKELNNQGTTIIYTTHYIEEVQSIASRVVIMDQGHVIARGTVDELVQKIQHEEKIKLEVVESNDVFIEKLNKLDGVKQVIKEDKQILIISSVGSGVLDRALYIAKDYGGVRSVNTEKPNLEDVFLTLTGKNLRDREEK